MLWILHKFPTVKLSRVMCLLRHNPALVIVSCKTLSVTGDDSFRTCSMRISADLELKISWIKFVTYLIVLRGPQSMIYGIFFLTTVGSFNPIDKLYICYCNIPTTAQGLHVLHPLSVRIFGGQTKLGSTWVLVL